MSDNKNNIEKQETVTEQKQKTDEQVGFCFSSFLKISDPNTDEILLQIRDE